MHAYHSNAVVFLSLIFFTRSQVCVKFVHFVGTRVAAKILRSIHLTYSVGAVRHLLKRRISAVPCNAPSPLTNPAAAVVAAFSQKELTAVRSEVSAAQSIFANVFGHSRSEGDGDAWRSRALNEWVQTYYRRQRPDLLLPALAHAARVPGALVGSAAMGGAVFLAHVLARVCSSAADMAAVLAHARLVAAAALADSGDNDVGLAHRLAEQLDTLLRAFMLCNRRDFDEVLREVQGAWRADLAAALAARGDAGGEQPSDLAALADSLLPPSTPARSAARAASLLAWPVPALDLPRFEAHLAAEAFSPYGATRHLFLHTRAAHLLASAGKARAADFAAFAPPLAALVTAALVDGYWSHFYATGDPAAISRVLDVGVLYLPFADEFGDAAIAGPASADDERWAGAFDGDALAHMRFEAGRHALWTLLANAQVHAQVGGWFLRDAGAALDSAALLDPVSRLATLSHEGERRLQLQRLLAPAMRTAHAHAMEYGIGSGQWPASYDEGASAAGSRVAALEAHPGATAAGSALHGAPSIGTSTDIGAAVAALLSAGADAAPSVGAGAGSSSDDSRRLLTRTRGGR